MVEFAVQLLTILGYIQRPRVTRTRKDIPLFICGEWMHAKADVCLIDRQQKDVLLLVQEEKRSTVDTNDAQHQLVAQAIAAFQYNNTLRTQVGEPAIKSQVLALSCYFMLCINALFRSYRASSFLVPRLYSTKFPSARILFATFGAAHTRQTRRLFQLMFLRYLIIATVKE